MQKQGRIKGFLILFELKMYYTGCKECADVHPIMMPYCNIAIFQRAMGNMAFACIVASLVRSVSTTTLHHMGAVHLGGVQLTMYECFTLTLAFG